MIRAFFRLIQAGFYWVTGQVDKARNSFASSPAVVGAKYDEVTSSKQKRLRDYTDAVTALATQFERKKETLHSLTKEVQKLETYRAGAIAKSKEIVKKLGGDTTVVKDNPDYIKCLSAYRDFSSTLEEKNKRIADIEQEVSEMDKTLEGHKAGILTLTRELQSLKGEKYDALADIVSAEEQKKMSDMFAGISDDKTNIELQELRDLRANSRAAAKVSQHLSGLSSQTADEEFLQFATRGQTDNEFDKLIGLTTEEPKASEPSAPTKIAEN